MGADPRSEFDINGVDVRIVRNIKSDSLITKKIAVRFDCHPPYPEGEQIIN